MACLEASAQVEVHEVMLGEDLPAGLAFRTEKPWSSEAGSLLEQLDDMEAFLRPWCAGDVFPMALGGEHGISLRWFRRCAIVQRWKAISVV